MWAQWERAMPVYGLKKKPDFSRYYHTGFSIIYLILLIFLVGGGGAVIHHLWDISVPWVVYPPSHRSDLPSKQKLK